MLIHAIDSDEAFAATVARARKKLDKSTDVEKPTMVSIRSDFGALLTSWLQDDANKTFRTRLVAFWLFTNGLLALIISHYLSRQAKTVYFQVSYQL